ncbi:GNAT family N-acetyltransferase [Sulfidibacter corallicola]|uniref:GNAT family N-acetyltransferase n=1 Tax=Sulfidibacter corallicola TaxID=2818388 RepID=A0A8A4TGS6_SULCO|nr:GNAT family N-acetyltransferase [Sulfidibacter corallicola]QTD49126.1 GNAT family N-acetyltransferase [Sulfidibacter corallicola]
MTSRFRRFEPIDTARCRIRRFRPEDLEPFAAFMADTTATAYLPFPDEHKTRAGARQLLEATLASYDSDRPMFALAVEARTNGRFAGFCGVNPLDETTAEIMYAVIPGASGQGYATEIAAALANFAIEKLGFRRLVAFIVPANEPSKVVAAKAGFADEGLVEHANFSEKVHRFAYTPDL